MTETIETVTDPVTLAENQVCQTDDLVAKLKNELTSLEGAEEVDKDKVKYIKGELKVAEKNLKSAEKSLATAKKAAEKAAEKAKKAAEKAAEKAAKEERLAAEKAAKAAEREANKMPEQNGIRKPKPGTLCGKVWQLADELSAKFNQPTPIKELLEIALAEGLNEGNVKAEYARWRKFHGVTGRVKLPEQPKPNDKPTE